MKNKLIRILLGLLGVIVLLVAGLYLWSETRINRTYAVAGQPLALPTDEAALAEGARLFVTRGCSDCHGADGRGTVMIDDPAIGRIAGSNLTTGAGGVLGAYDDALLARAIRNGLDENGRPLLFMPSWEFQGFSDEDTAMLIAHMRNLPPVDNVLPASQSGPMGRILFLAGQLPLVPAEMVNHDAPKVASVTVEASVAYGDYLAQGCIGCHGTGFSGGAIPGAPLDWPVATNITPDRETGMGDWTQADFVADIRTGVRPDGSTIDPLMPWANFSLMTDVELEALWLYLETVAPQAEGNR